jgi:hypothetical protein
MVFEEIGAMTRGSTSLESAGAACRSCSRLSACRQHVKALAPVLCECDASATGKPHKSGVRWRMFVDTIQPGESFTAASLASATGWTPRNASEFCASNYAKGTFAIVGRESIPVNGGYRNIYIYNAM